MKGGESYVEEAEERIYKAGGLERCEKADLLTGLAIFTGLKDKEKARKLIEKRRDIMIESAAYEIIKQEGFEEGFKAGVLKGKEEGFKEGLQEGIQKGLQEGIQKGLQEGIQEGLREAIELGLKLKFGVEGLKLWPEIERIKEIELLRAIKEALEVATSLEEIKEFLKQN
jgi:flagellar biosynthesis/type III secretory pathway protein FliH